MKHYLASYTLSANNSDLVNDYIIKITDAITDGEFDEYVENTIHYSLEDDLKDFIWNYFNEYVIYYKDQWDIIENYFTPEDLYENALYRAYELLADDIVRGIEVSEEDDEEGGAE